MTDDALLDEVSAAAEAALEAHAAGGGSEEPMRHKAAAAHAALDAGIAIAAIAAAEVRGEQAARARVGAHVLRAVERSAKKRNEAVAEHDRAVAQAVALGLPAREIAARAGVSHGTVAAVARRYGQASTPPPTVAVQDEPAELPDAEVRVSPEAGSD